MSDQGAADDRLATFIARFEGRGITNPDEIAVVQEHIDPVAADAASAADRAYFEQHPEEESYVRPAIPGELPFLGLPAPPPGFFWEKLITVENVQPGIRCRHGWSLLVPDEER